MNHHLEASGAPDGLITTHRSLVTEDQIDHLGHMNVRFYGVNAWHGTEAVMASLGVSVPFDEHIVEMYTRHHREQLLGAELAVHSGVVGVDQGVLRIYHQLVDEATGTLAATFFHGLALDSTTGRSPLPTDVAGRASAIAIATPAHGASRTINLDGALPIGGPAISELRDAGLAVREVRTLHVDECGPDGLFPPRQAAELSWGGVPVEGSVSVMLHDGPNGEVMGWAAMESRGVIHRMPRAGDRIQTFSATIDIADKTIYRIQWVYDVDRGDPLVTTESVSLAFDARGRRAMSIPAELRAAERSRLRPDLAPHIAARPASA